ncbi:DUF2200 family protein [Microbacterium trichothecenolyticum]|nr:DUF2200 family protein [Microbacterium trichothecenolyticum]
MVPVGGQPTGTIFFVGARRHRRHSMAWVEASVRYERGRHLPHAVEEIEDPLMQKIRYLDKLVDELARGKSMEKILRVA